MKLKKYISYAFIVLGLIIAVSSCNCSDKKEVKQMENSYPISPVDIRNVHLDDNFWLPIIKRVQEKTIEFALEKCEEEGRFDNFLLAGGKKEGTVKGAMPFDDTDVYKIIEGASNSLISEPNPELELLLDSLIKIIAIGQEEDGYLTTWRTINPAQPPATWVKVDEGKRWEFLFMSHELYNAGHLYEAACVHYKATGKRNFLDIAIKNANLMVKTFGDGEGKIHAVPGHQIIETGLLNLYKITNNKDYAKLAKYFLDNRGNPENHELFGEYSQDHIPVVQQDEVVGHAVRAVYMYAAMTDIAVLEKDSAYNSAVNKLWNNMVEKKIYITGGIGARHDGESFGDNYELPNLTSYNETCAAIGSVYWNHRLHSKTGDAKYFDVIERTLYNGLISGLSLDGINFFYPNALEADGEYEFNRGSCTRQSWFDCSCCPTNIIRFIPSIPGLMYSKTDNSIYVNLYASSNSKIGLADNTFTIDQQTDYPWNGKVSFNISPEKEKETTINFRIPSWARNKPMPGNLYHFYKNSDSQVDIYINGKKSDVGIENGYFSIKREWKKDDKVEINFPMPVRLVEADPKVKDDIAKVSLERGPLVYAIEEIDNQKDFDNIKISPEDKFTVDEESDLLDGVYTISNNNFKAIPYYSWSNRGVGKMKVWIDINE